MLDSLSLNPWIHGSVVFGSVFFGSIVAGFIVTGSEPIVVGSVVVRSVVVESVAADRNVLQIILAAVFHCLLKYLRCCGSMPL